jgi:hypothetical protein
LHVDIVYIAVAFEVDTRSFPLPGVSSFRWHVRPTSDQFLEITDTVADGVLCSVDVEGHGQ